MLPLFVYNMNAGIIRAGRRRQNAHAVPITGERLSIFCWTGSAWRTGAMGVDGAAWATAFSQMVGSPGICNLPDAEEGCLPSELAERPHFRGKSCGPFLRIGRARPGCQNLVITISNIFVQTAVNGLGVTAIAAFTAYFKVELILYLPIMAFRAGGHHLRRTESGRRKAGSACGRGIRTCLLLGSVYAAGMARADASAWPACVRPGLHGETAVSRGPRLRIIRVTFPWLLAVCVSGGACGRPAGLRPFRTGPIGRHHDLPVRAADRAAGRLYECLGDAGGGGRRLSMRLAGSGSVSDGVLRRYAVKPIKK